jgi:hypothetical protein
MYESPSMTTSLGFTWPFSQGAGMAGAPSGSVRGAVASDFDGSEASASSGFDDERSPPELEPEPELEPVPEPDDPPDPDEEDDPGSTELPPPLPLPVYSPVDGVPLLLHAARSDATPKTTQPDPPR